MWEQIRRSSETRVNSRVPAPACVAPEQPTTDEAGIDSDFWRREFEQKRQELKERCQNAQLREDTELSNEEELIEKLARLGTHSYGWFKALLEREGATPTKTAEVAQGDASESEPVEVPSDQQEETFEISILFRHVKRLNSDTLLLTSPNKAVPAELQNHLDIPLQLVFAGGRTMPLVLESVSVSPSLVKARIKYPEKADSVDFSAVTLAGIYRKDPSFLVQEFYKQFVKMGNQRGYAEETLLLSAECMPGAGDITFVYGPPGTGKTTHLVEHVLMQIDPATKQLQPRMMKDSATGQLRRMRILVLTPTNKAADVIVNRLLEKMPTGSLPCIRYGSCEDETLKQVGVCKGTGDMLTEHELMLPLVTTMVRLPYNKVNNRILCEREWDLVVMDEASMIPLYQTIFALLRLKPTCGFVIAGDPKQVGPITKAPQWEGQNIYTAVKLDSFDSPRTVPHDYTVQRLETQYRSVPAIGELYSRFTYSGRLHHARSTEQWHPLGDTHFKALNLLHFPVDRSGESIYVSKKLDGSPYHIYSALFAHELALYIAQQWKAESEQEAQEGFHIGIITPYRVQADLIEKLVLSAPRLPDLVSIQVGTVHSFQGDQCEAVISVCNAPRGAGVASMVNNATILNVGLSRAKDYLFVLAPRLIGKNGRPYGSLNNLDTIKALMLEIGAQHGDILASDDCRMFEALMRGSNRYLEQNTYATSHLPVNLYTESSHIYELRCTDNAIDIQVNEQLRARRASSPGDDEFGEQVEWSEGF